MEDWTAVLLGMMQEVIAQGPGMSVVDARAIGSALIQLAAACVETLAPRQAGTNAGRGTVSLVSIKAAIGQRLADPLLTPQVLLDEFGISRSTLPVVV